MISEETGTSVVIHFNHMSTDEDVRSHIRQRCDHMAAEFPETSHYEISLRPDASSIRADVHASGRGTHVAAHATHDDLRRAGEIALEKLHRELRRHHDKRIFMRRREARKMPGKRIAVTP